MKKFPFWILIFLVMALSCQRKASFETLRDCDSIFSDIYSLKNQHPDSAFALFSSVSDTLDESLLRQRSDFLFAEYQVLKKELCYKNYRLSGNDSLVANAFLFYDSVTNASYASRKNEFLLYQLARASYYKAVAEERKEDGLTQAFVDYLKSLWITDGLSGKRRVFAPSMASLDYVHFTGLIYDRLAWILYNNDVFDLSIECLEQSNACFEREGDLLGIASNYDLMGDVMLALEDRTKAVHYYEVSDSVSAMLQDKGGISDFTYNLHRALKISTLGNKHEAKSMLQNVLANSSRTWTVRRSHFGLAYIYTDLGVYDSALYHYEQSIPLLPRQNVKSYAHIVRLSNMLGDSLKAARYGEILSEYCLKQVRQSGMRTRLVTLYENFKAESKAVHDKDVLYFSLMIVLLLAVVILVDSLYIQRRKRKHEKEIALHERIKADLEDEISTAKDEAIRKDGKIKELEVELEKVITNPNFYKLPLEDKLATLYEMPISKRVRKVMDANVKAGVSYPELVLSDNQTNMLVNAVDAVFPKFSVRLIEMYPRLNRSDVEYCCMYILGVTEIQAAALTGKTYQAVWKRSLKLHNIFDNKADLKFVMHDLLRSWK